MAKRKRARRHSKAAAGAPDDAAPNHAGHMSEADLWEVAVGAEVVPAPKTFSLDAEMAKVLSEQDAWNDDARGRKIITFGAADEIRATAVPPSALYSDSEDGASIDDQKPTVSKKRRSRRSKTKQPQTLEDVALRASHSEAHHTYPAEETKFDMKTDPKTTKGCWQAKKEESSEKPPTLADCAGLKLIPWDEKSQ